MLIRLLAFIKKSRTLEKECFDLSSEVYQRLIKLRTRLDQIQNELKLLQKKEQGAPMFRKSYGYEAWCEVLAQVAKPLYDLMDYLLMM